MNKLFKSLVIFTALIFTQGKLNAQNIHDTLKVQTFTFESATRDTMINFPTLNSNEIERVWMKYTMRCREGQMSTSPATTSYGCGAWDYSCNTYLTDSSRIDSIAATIDRYQVYPAPSSDNWYNNGVTYQIYGRNQTQLNGLTMSGVNNYPIATATGSSSSMMTSTTYGGKLYILLNSATLTGSGLQVGNIGALSLINQGSAANIKNLKIQMKEVGTNTFATINTSSFTGFQQVYFLDRNIVNGSNQLVFNQNFNWTGGNILIEISGYGFNASNLNLATATLSYPATLYTNNNKFARLITNSYIDVPNYKGIGGANPRTVEAWIRTATNGKEIAAWGADSTGRRFTFRIDATGGLRVEINGGYVVGATNVCDNQWHHVAAVFSGTNLTGVKFYVDGVLDANASINSINVNTDNKADVQISKSFFDRYFNGDIDDIRIWSAALDANTLAFYRSRKVDANHPNYSALELNYTFNEQNATVVDNSTHARNGVFQNYPQFGSTYRLDHNWEYVNTSTTPVITMHQGTFNFTTSTVTVQDSIPQLPYIVIENAFTPNPGTLLSDITSSIYPLWPKNNLTYNTSGTLTATTPGAAQTQLVSQTYNYFKRTPSRVELMSFVTPYGIGLDLGVNGKTWVFDVTDYLPILQGSKRLTMERGGQNQEEIDIAFDYIYGTPVRPVLDMRQIWKVDSRSYTLIMNNSYFEPVNFKFVPQTTQAKVRSMITGHGQEGEFISRNHFIDFNNGAQVNNWSVWKECGENPVYPQGGTWIYDRAGWCPGMPTDLKEWDVTPYITSNAVNVDYGITTATGTSNYIVNHQMVSYGATSFATDARIQSVKAPSNQIVNARFNPICSQPAIIVQNSGTNAITSLTITYKVNDGATDTYTWTGNLAFLEEEEITLPTSATFWTPLTAGENNFTAIITAVNGAEDEYSYNNSFKSTFEVHDFMPSSFIFKFKSNNAAAESSYQLLDVNNNVIFTRTGMANATIYNDTFNLTAGCYKLIVRDTGDDGIDFWANNDGVGFLELRNITGSLIKSFEADFGDGVHYEFSVGSALGVNEIKAEKDLLVYPNPANDQVNVKVSGFSNAEWTVFDQFGRIIQTGKTDGNPFYAMSINISSFNSGMYMIQFTDGKNRTMKSFIKE